MSAYTKWNANQPFPRSYDGTPAVYCEKDGVDVPSIVRTKYIKIYEMTADGVRTMKIFRLFKPKDRVPPLDIQKMKEELQSNKSYNIKLAGPANRMRARLMRIYGKLGITYLDALQITKITPEVDTACWGVTDKEEFIMINPYLLMQRVMWASFVLQHEILHRALYRGRENLGDRELVNVVLDICCNRILSATSGGKKSNAWTEFCEWIYPEESKKTVLALCNASLSSDEVSRLRMINPIYAKIWEELYGSENKEVQVTSPKTGRTYIRKIKNKLSFAIQNLSPDDLYFRLKDQITEQDRKALKGNGAGLKSDQDNTEAGLNPFGERNIVIKVANNSITVKTDAHVVATDLSGRAERALRKSMVPKKFRHSIDWQNWSDCRTEFWDKFVKTPEDIYDPKLEEYAKRIKTQKVMENITGRLIEVLENDTVMQVYPHRLTEEGIIMAGIGFRPPFWPWFINQEGEEGRRRIVVFFDLSPSMTYFFPHMCYMTDTFEDVMELVFATNAEGDPGVLTFAGSIRALTREEIEQMRHGEIKVGASTCFNAMVEYCVDKIKTEDVDAVICFTDGLSGLSQDNIKAFRETGKKMYRIYMVEDRKNNREQQVTSDLDFLPGESFTLHVPKTDITKSKKKQHV